MRSVITESDLSRADAAKAEQHRKESILLSSAGDYLPIWWSNTHDLAVGGVGIEMYFLFLKQMIMLFLVLSILSIPLLYTNASGGQITTKEDSGYFQKTTLANMKTLSYSVTDPIKANEVLNDSKNAQVMTLTLDLVISAVFMVSILGFGIFNEYRIRRSDEQVPRTSMFALELSGLPQNETTAEDLGAHLQENYGPVVECTLARDISDPLKIYQRLATVDAEIIREETRCQYREDTSVLVLEKLRQHRTQIMSTIATQNQAAVPGSKPKIVKGFVVFDDVRDKLRCAHARPWCLIGSKGPIYKDHELTVTDPKEPSDIVWENIRAPHLLGDIVRGTISFLATIGLLIVAFVAVYGASYYVSQLPSESDCTKVPPGNENGPTATAEMNLDPKTVNYCFCSEIGWVS